MQINIDVHDKHYIDINTLIDDYIPFIVQTISSVTNRYVSMENDEEFSIGLLAFYEAAQKYTATRGSFLPFAKLVIRSRLLNYLNSTNKDACLHALEDELDEHTLHQYASEYLDTDLDTSDLLADEITTLNTYLEDFGFDLSLLATESPTHKQTRENAISLGEKISQDEPLTSWMYFKKRLPITQIALQFNVTQKVIKGSKKFIITVVIIFDKKLRNLKLWIGR